jgi:hypothetical protein
MYIDNNRAQCALGMRQYTEFVHIWSCDHILGWSLLFPAAFLFFCITLYKELLYQIFYLKIFCMYIHNFMILTVSDASVKATSQFLSSAMLLLWIVGN